MPRLLSVNSDSVRQSRRKHRHDLRLFGKAFRRMDDRRQILLVDLARKMARRLSKFRTRTDRIQTRITARGRSLVFGPVQASTGFAIERNPDGLTQTRAVTVHRWVPKSCQIISTKWFKASWNRRHTFHLLFANSECMIMP
jgi:hypothetical protein